MNNENIKVSFKQVEEIISKLNATSSLINSKITNYKTNLKSIIDKGYLDGVAELSINISCDKVAKLCTEFKEYSDTLVSKLNKVITETQQVESGAKQNLDSILTLDPTKFLAGATMFGGALSLDPTKAFQIEKTGSIGSNASAGPALNTNGITTPIKDTTTQAEPKTETPKEDSKVETTPTPAPTPAPAPKTGKKMSVPSGNTALKTYTNISKTGIKSNTPQSAILYGEDGFTMSNGSHRSSNAMPYGKYAGQTYNTQTDPNTGVRYVTFEGDSEKYYCAALGTYYGQVGDTFKVTTDNGNTFNVIMCDAKGSDAVYMNGTNSTWYHNHGGQKSVVEFYCEFIPDAMKVKGGNTGTFNSVPQFSGNISSIEKLS